MFVKQLERLQQQMASMQRIIEETNISERNRLQATANAGLRGSSSDSDLLPVSRKSDWNTAAAANAELAALFLEGSADAGAAEPRDGAGAGAPLGQSEGFGIALDILGDLHRGNLEFFFF